MIDLEAADPAETWSAEREDMLELCGNLIDNACKWAANRVRIRIPSDIKATLIIEDDGPGCPPERREQLGERGRRFDEQTGGHGLGLNIARDIVEHYDGSIDFNKSTLGGLRVQITFSLTNRPINQSTN